MAEAEDIIDHEGQPRKLGCLAVDDGFKTSFQAYAEAGKPMFTKAQLIENATNNDTRGSSLFDSSWIMDQKSHGSCNGFSLAAAASKTRVRRMLPRVMLSGAYAYSLMNGGSDNGSALADGMRLCQARGIATAATVTVNQIYPRLYDKPKADAEAARFKFNECYVITTELELFSALAAKFDVVFAVDVDQSFYKLDSNGIAGGGRGRGNHSVHGDGYYVLTNGQLVADGVNNWNTSYGNQGRMGLTWDKHFANTVQWHGFFAIRTSIDDPQGTNPPPII